jgi:hypothetical protein
VILVMHADRNQALDPNSREELAMSTTSPSTGWIRVGLVALPVYGLVVGFATLQPQPDPTTNPEVWAQFVSSQSYLLEHLASGVIGAVLAIFGTFALGSLLTDSRAGRLALWGTVLAVAGHVLFLAPGNISTFATPAIGTAYLSGNREVMALAFSPVLTAIFGIALLLALIGNVVLGLAIWRSGVLPRWTGVIWIAAALVFYAFGALLGLATTGASLPTQPIGGLLMAVSSGGIAWTVLRSHSAPSRTAPALTATRPVPQTSH